MVARVTVREPAQEYSLPMSLARDSTEAPVFARKVPRAVLEAPSVTSPVLRQ